MQNEARLRSGQPKREQKSGNWPDVLDAINRIGLPPADDEYDMSVPVYVSAAQSEGSVWEMKQQMARLQLDLNKAKDTVDAVGRLLVEMAEAYVPEPVDEDDAAARYRRALSGRDDTDEGRAYQQAKDGATALLSAWQQFERILADIVADWRAAVAVAEQDLRWQALNAGAEA